MRNGRNSTMKNVSEPHEQKLFRARCAMIVGDVKVKHVLPSFEHAFVENLGLYVNGVTAAATKVTEHIEVHWRRRKMRCRVGVWIQLESRNGMMKAHTRADIVPCRPARHPGRERVWGSCGGWGEALCRRWVGQPSPKLVPFISNLPPSSRRVGTLLLSQGGRGITDGILASRVQNLRPREGRLTGPGMALDPSILGIYALGVGVSESRATATADKEPRRCDLAKICGSTDKMTRRACSTYEYRHLALSAVSVYCPVHVLLHQSSICRRRLREYIGTDYVPDAYRTST